MHAYTQHTPNSNGVGMYNIIGHGIPGLYAILCRHFEFVLTKTIVQVVNKH